LKKKPKRYVNILKAFYIENRRFTFFWIIFIKNWRMKAYLINKTCAFMTGSGKEFGRKMLFGWKKISKR